MLRFLGRCRERLDERGFDPNGKVYQSVARAYDAIHNLYVELHYESIPHGVGRPPKDGDRVGGGAPPGAGAT
jgi:hypothetical protein